MRVQMYADFTCPFSYMGKRRLDEAIAATNMPIEFELKAFQLSPEAPTSQSIPTVQLLAKKFGKSIDETMATTVRLKEQAASMGLYYNYETMKASNTLNAHRLTKWAKQYGKHANATEAFFKALFTDGANLNDHEELLTIIESIGLKREEATEVLASVAFAEEVAQDKKDALASGIHSVPVFIINNQYMIQGVQPVELFLQTFEKVE